MKPNILDRRPRTDWSPLTRALFLPPIVLIAIALVLLVANGTQRASPGRPRISNNVLYIGDSLSVGDFGQVLYDYLASNFGPRNVAMYAMCGSSPEHWLRSQPTFFSRCGYREFTFGRTVLVQSGPRHPTPKVEDLLARHHPGTVIVQLGTNWMDQIAIHDTPQKEAELSAILDRFTETLRNQSRVRIIWIAPPDSAHYNQRVQRVVENLLHRASSRDNFDMISSRDITHYIPGKTGRDGVHYNSEASAEWAHRIVQRLRYRYGWESVAY